MTAGTRNRYRSPFTSALEGGATTGIPVEGATAVTTTETAEPIVYETRADLVAMRDNAAGPWRRFVTLMSGRHLFPPGATLEAHEELEHARRVRADVAMRARAAAVLAEAHENEHTTPELPEGPTPAEAALKEAREALREVKIDGKMVDTLNEGRSIAIRNAHKGFSLPEVPTEASDEDLRYREARATALDTRSKIAQVFRFARETFRR